MVRAQRRDGGDGRAGPLRAAVLFVGLCLAGAATVALLGTTDPRTLRLAVVGALWAFLLAALAVPRRRSVPPGARDLLPGREVELRRAYEIELEREVAARREYELQLEVYLRRELEQGMRNDVDSLREEVQRLRSEVLDRLDGELRMERIETTRLIGGSLRALQDEARRLGISRPLIADDVGFSIEEPGLAGREAVARAELEAAAPAGGSLYASLQRPGPAEQAPPASHPEPPVSRGYVPPQGHEPAAPWPGEPASAVPAPRDYEPVPPTSRQPTPAVYGGYEPPRGPEPAAGWPGEPVSAVPRGFEPRPPWPAEPGVRSGGGYESVAPASREPGSPVYGGYEPRQGHEPAARWPGEPVSAVPPPRGSESIGQEPTPPASSGDDPPSRGHELAASWPGEPEYEPPSRVDGPRRSDRAPAHRAAEDPGPPASGPGSRGRRRDRSRNRSAPPGDGPSYPADDELSRIFAGSIGPQVPRTAPEHDAGQPHRRRRDDGESNEVLSRLLGRG